MDPDLTPVPPDPSFPFASLLPLCAAVVTDPAAPALAVTGAAAAGQGSATAARTTSLEGGYAQQWPKP